MSVLSIKYILQIRRTLSNLFSRNTCNDRKGWHILRDYGTCCDHCSFTNRNAVKNNHAWPNPSSIPNADGTMMYRVATEIGVTIVVLHGPYLHSRGEIYVFSNSEPCPGIQYCVIANNTTIAYNKVPRVAYLTAFID